MLSAGSGSGVALPTVAVLERAPVKSPSRSATTLIVTGPSVGSTDPSEQRTVWSAPTGAHVPAVVVTVAPNNATSRTSSTVTSVAVEGPSLSIVMVKVTACSGTSTCGETVFTRETSAEGAAAADTVAVRSACFGSAVGDWTRATAGLAAGEPWVGAEES